jgi:heme/copper-type cytochrome/quinol oxidase subunit 2
MTIRSMKRLLLASLALWPLAAARAADPVQLQLTLKDHKWSPVELHVPVGTPVILTIRNEDTTAEEFDSSDLRVEKVIPGQYTATVRLRPLAAGRYHFIGEYHEDTAKGVVIAE